MSQISATYASPLLRWALLLEDHPQATYRYKKVQGVDLPEGHEIPVEFGGNDDYALCTITFPPETGLEDAHGYKSTKVGVNGKGGATSPVTNSEQWQQLCTKTLGRALKRCGYPDDMDELRAVMRWRNEVTRLRALEAGVPLNALGAGKSGETIEAALADAGRPDADTAPDQPEHDGVIDADSEEVAVAQTPEAPVEDLPEALVEQHRQAMNKAAKGGVQTALKEWCADQQISWTKPATAAHAEAVIAKIDELLAAAAQ